MTQQEIEQALDEIRRDVDAVQIMVWVAMAGICIIAITLIVSGLPELLKRL